MLLLTLSYTPTPPGTPPDRPMTSPMPHPGFAERWAVWYAGDGLGCEPGTAGSGVLGQGVQVYLENSFSGFLGWKICIHPPTPVYGSDPRVGRSKIYNSMIYIKNGGPSRT